MEINEIINKDEIYTISLYHGKLNYDSILEVVSNNFEVGDLKLSGNNNSILRVELELAYGKLHYYKLNAEYWLNDIKLLDNKLNQKIFKYKIENLDRIKNEISKYKSIRIWIDKNDSNSYLFGLFFCSEFYDLIKNKNIKIVNLDDFYKKEIRLYELILNNQIEENELSLEKVNKYKLEWKKQLEINSEIRDVSNGVIKNLSYKDLYNPVLEVIKSLGRVNRMVVIPKLQNSDILNNGHPIIYNYIIRCLIKNNIINEYEIDYSKNKDISNYETEDEYKNNEIEYVE